MNILIILVIIAEFILLPYPVYGSNEIQEYPIYSYDAGIDMVKKAISSNNFP